jgi:hypothetical protein
MVAPPTTVKSVWIHIKPLSPLQSDCLRIYSCIQKFFAYYHGVAQSTQIVTTTDISSLSNVKFKEITSTLDVHYTSFLLYAGLDGSYN